MSDPTISDTAVPIKRRKSTPKSIKELRAMVSQIDALVEKLGDRPEKQVPLITEKSGLVQKLLALEVADEANDLELQHATDTTKIEELSERIAELTAENARLRVAAATPMIERIPDPDHVAVRQERDTLQRERDDLKKVISGFLEAISDPDRAEAVIKAAVKLFPVHPKIGDILQEFTAADLRWLQWLPKFWLLDQRSLEQHQGAADRRIDRLVTEVLEVRFPKPKPARTGPDTRTLDERNRDAVLRARQELDSAI